MRNTNHYLLLLVPTLMALVAISACEQAVETPRPGPKMDRAAVVKRHHPQLKSFDPQSPFTVGNGKFAFTADVTGLQSYADTYYQSGIPLETKARWAWHTRDNPENFTLADSHERYPAYGREVEFPSNMRTQAARWLRMNPHDLPLARIGFSLNGARLDQAPTKIQQKLDLWRGELNSQFRLAGEDVRVLTLVDNESDRVAAEVESDLLADKLAIDIRFARGYRDDRKNTPDLDFSHPQGHRSEIIYRPDKGIILQRNVDDSEHLVFVQWQGEAVFEEVAEHHYRLRSADNSKTLRFSVRFSQIPPEAEPLNFAKIRERSAEAWQAFWEQGAFVDFAGSRDPRAQELERRVILSRYLMAVQARANMPSQESGLTHSSWYGKHHSEMTWWHSAHWAYWGQPEETEKVLQWYKSHLDSARELAKQRGLQGARWAKMIGPDNRESPGGNPLIIWNQPQLIHLAELVFQSGKQHAALKEYAELVEESAEAMASMLVWDTDQQRYNLDAPIWIAQEIYNPRLSKNPTFELAYWRSGLQIAQKWRERRDAARSEAWQHRIDKLASLPVKDDKYVAIESIPDTFDNVESRRDHPSMLAAYGLLNSPRVKPETMRNTLHAVLQNWDWKNKIWGWDYPMIAMTAARLDEPHTAIDILLAEKAHNKYLTNGHVPQPGAELRAYLPANGALLAAVAMMLSGWEGAPKHDYPGFPRDDSWSIKTEGFRNIR